ncbi:ATP-dependent nuclease [Hydrogenophaga intermedia]|uniref:ATP-dependent nuclease n=1 Tax=Hydrogenophaga intermedia TaxID=65786 RepID=UPI00204408F2|nr:AAA family ATPase [Hydrogenophaga intermedia]MCM3565450.1 ATP-binding protein [Hydrogenophaga intermedia]
MYQYDQRPNTQLDAESHDTLRRIRELEYAVLVGRNNCGKSFLLKSLTQQWGQSASYLGPARYQNFNLLGYYTPNRNRRDERWRQFMQQWQQQQQNIDNSPVNLQQAIAELSDAQRASLIEIVDTLLGVKLEIRQTVEGNSMSQRYISCDGHNISYTSSGFRLIATLVTSLLDAEYDTFLIDEPELGISPEAQGVLADFLFDRQHRARYFPHIRTLVFATHSTVFLDRHHVSNNHVVTKHADTISVRPVTSQSEFNRVHFFLLGNRFETLYLPSAIVLVEGKTDHRFIERVCAVRFPNAQLSVISANSDTRIKEVLSVARGLLADIQRSPYRDRIFVVLDSVHSASLPAQLVQMGLQPENIITWPMNGIEYYYPPAVMDKIYGAGGDLEIEGDRVSRNALTYSKNDLMEKVSSLTEQSTALHPDFESLFLSKVAAKIG